MITSPLVSIITPNYNCERFISQTIESVLAQTYKNWEMLIVDDCSTDKSYEIACEYAKKDSRIKVFRNKKNSGAAVSRNVAIEKSKGEYLAFLDSDDLWMPQKLEKQLAFMQVNNCDFSFTEYEHIDEDNNSLGKCCRVVKNLSFIKLLHHDFIGCLTAMYKAASTKTIRAFDIKNNNDYGLFLQVVKNSKKAMGLHECLAKYRIRKSSISRKKIGKVIPYFQLMHKCMHFPYFLCCWFLFCNILIGKVWKYKNCKS